MKNFKKSHSGNRTRGAIIRNPDKYTNVKRKTGYNDFSPCLRVTASPCHEPR